MLRGTDVMDMSSAMARGNRHQRAAVTVTVTAVLVEVLRIGFARRYMISHGHRGGLGKKMFLKHRLKSRAPGTDGLSLDVQMNIKRGSFTKSVKP
jgi:hypothetical protein